MKDINRPGPDKRIVNLIQIRQNLRDPDPDRLWRPGSRPDMRIRIQTGYWDPDLQRWLQVYELAGHLPTLQFAQIDPFSPPYNLHYPAPVLSLCRLYSSEETFTYSTLKITEYTLH